jgi:NAD(P)-dependent dehydrogenase (short-subunit alcohol dehydrogenase family)
MNDKKVALVTGVSSGIGRQTAQRLAQGGFRVFGTIRDDSTTEDTNGVEMIVLDLTDDGSVTSAVKSVLHKAGQLHVLVNSAGYALTGGLEETSIHEAQQLFDTNFFGTLRMTLAVLPVMRLQGYGRIVNISSVLGFLPMPYMGIYVASKHALEGLTETLDHEVRQFGVRALLIEPSFTKTNLAKKGKTVQAVLDVYAEQKRRVTGIVESRIAQGDDPSAVAEAVYQAATADSPQLRYPVGEGKKLNRLRRFIPARMFDQTFRKQFQLDEPVRR